MERRSLAGAAARGAQVRWAALFALIFWSGLALFTALLSQVAVSAVEGEVRNSLARKAAEELASPLLLQRLSGQLPFEQEQEVIYTYILDGAGRLRWRDARLPGLPLPVRPGELPSAGRLTTIRSGDFPAEVFQLPFTAAGQRGVLETASLTGAQVATESALARAGALALLLAAPLSLALGWLTARLATRPLRQALEAQREFVADAWHELRTPLAVVRAAVEVAEKAAPASLRPLLDDAAVASIRATRIVADLGWLARAEGGDLPLDLQPVQVAALLGEQMGALRLLRSEVNLEADLQPVVARADPDRLAQVVWALVDNATKHGGSAGTVWIRSRAAGRWARVEVEDAGRGLNPEQRRLAFERFFHIPAVDESRDPGSGSGLGLPIARQLARAQGGDLWLAAGRRGGVLAVLRLPRER